MRFQHVSIEALGFVLPPNVITSMALEDGFRSTLQRIGLPPGQVEKLSGIRERRWWDPGVQPSTVAAMAGQQALDEAGLSINEIDVLINTSVSRDYLEPATAAIIGGHLGLPHSAYSFDITNACVGWLNGVHLAATLVESGQAKRVLVVCGEVVRNGVESTLRKLAADTATSDTFRDHFATLTLGSGAVAAVITRREVAKVDHRLHGVVLGSAHEHNTLCLANHAEMISNAHGLLVHGIGLAVELLPQAIREFGWGPDSVDTYVCHQVSVAHFQTGFKRLELPLEKAILTLPYLGNCGPCSTPLTLALGVAQGQIVPGHEVCLWGVGSGLAGAVMGVSW